MAYLDQEYRADDLPESSSFDPLPAGWYSATISDAELKQTKSGTGQYIRVRYDITGPTHQGRVVFGNINIRNQNPAAEEIGRQQLGEIMRAIGLARVSDTDQLIGGSLKIKLTIREADGQYDASNEVKGFKAMSGAMPSQPQVAAAPQPQRKAPPTASPPWAKKPAPSASDDGIPF